MILQQQVEKIIGLDKIADAYAKAMVADFIGTFSKERFYVAKNRMGEDQAIFGTKVCRVNVTQPFVMFDWQNGVNAII